MNNLSLNPSPGGGGTLRVPVQKLGSFYPQTPQGGFRSNNTEVGNKNVKNNEDETNSRI